MAYKKAIYSQKANFYEQKLNACGSNSQKKFKIVNKILDSNLNPISNRLSDYNMCSYLYLVYIISYLVYLNVLNLNWP